MKALTQAVIMSLGLGMSLSACQIIEGAFEDRPQDIPRDAGIPQTSFDAGRSPFPPGSPSVGSVMGLPSRLAELRTAADPPPPISGGSLAVSADSRYAVAADADRDAVFVVRIDTLEVRKVELSAGSEPGRVAFDTMGGVHVALRSSGRLVRIDLASASVDLETEVCEHPRGVAFDPANKAVVASCIGGQLVSFDAMTHEESGRATLPHDLRDVIVDSTGRCRVARYRSAELLSLNADSSVERATRPNPLRSFGGPLDLAVLLDGGFEELIGDGGPLADIVRDAAAAGTSDAGVPFASPTLAWRTVLGASGSFWMLHQQSQEGEVGTSVGGYGAGCQPITTGAITEFDADGVSLRSMPIALQGLSVDLAVSPDEEWVAVASPGGYVAGAPTIQVYPSSNMQAAPAAEQCPVATSANGTETQTIAVTFGNDGLLYALSREPAELTVYSLDTSSASVIGAAPALERIRTIALDRSSVRDTGHDLFHADVGHGLSCAACHGEARDDGHIWNFQRIGPRRTQNIRGGLLATAPFHWDGDQPSMDHLVDDVMIGRMGGFKVDATYAAALGQWIDQQPALRQGVTDADAVERGKALFESSEVACSTCHVGASFTNNLNMDVGTGGAFQVPTLRGLGLRAPYMHDGCAKTLEQRFDRGCGGTQHGNTSQLSEAQIADLVAYLRSL